MSIRIFKAISSDSLPEKGKDVKVDLNSTLFYYESIATKDGPIRSAQIRDVVMKLRKILARVENEVQGMSFAYEYAQINFHSAYAALEGGIEKLREEHNKVFDDPSLQKFRVSSANYNENIH